jgi:type IV secretory pathway VirD2 relaxase
VAQTVHGGRVQATGRHLAYLQRDGVGEDGGRGQLLSAADRPIDPDAFRYQATHDLSQYRLVVSPWSRGEHMQAFVRELMTRVERDLGTETNWLAASHHNTPHVHAHVVVRGVDADDRPLVIDPWYLQHGIQERAGEVVRETPMDRLYDRLLGEEDRRLHRLAALGPTDPRYQAEIRARLAEIRAERLEMRRAERGPDRSSPGRERARALIAEVQRTREDGRGR